MVDSPGKLPYAKGGPENRVKGAIMPNAALHRYMMHAIDWEADRLMAGANLSELRGHGDVDFERALTRLQDFIRDQRLRDANFKKGWVEQSLTPAELKEVLQAHAAAHGIGKKPEGLEKALPRQGVTPIGGITPGGYKKIAEDVYIPADQQQRQPAGQAAPPVPEEPNRVDNTVVEDIESEESSIGDFYHVGGKIEEISSEGTFGSFLFFSRGEPEHYNVRPEHAHTYKVQIPESSILKVNTLFHPTMRGGEEDDTKKLEPLIQEMMEDWNIPEGEAVDLLDESQNVWDYPWADADESWKQQKYTARAAKLLGYRGVAIEDEHGTSFMIDMGGHGRDLKLIKKPGN